MKTYQIDEKTVSAILNYLGTRPYAEVWEGVAALQALKEIPEAKEKAVDAKQ